MESNPEIVKQKPEIDRSKEIQLVFTDEDELTLLTMESSEKSVTKVSALEGKIQTPQVKVSQVVEDKWGEWKLE